jgi:hypothetical protein
VAAISALLSVFELGREARPAEEDPERGAVNVPLEQGLAFGLGDGADKNSFR